VSTLEGQLRRVYAQYRKQANDLRKWVYLANLWDRNEVLFYRVLTEHISEMLPVVYTPAVGLAIEGFVGDDSTALPRMAILATAPPATDISS
jgi:malate dehydrogenase (oxaloacetate-decarboxylating)